MDNRVKRDGGGKVMSDGEMSNSVYDHYIIQFTARSILPHITHRGRNTQAGGEGGHIGGEFGRRVSSLTGYFISLYTSSVSLVYNVLNYSLLSTHVLPPI